MEKKGLRVNMGKLKIMVTGIILDLPKFFERILVCQTGLGSNAIFCEWLIVMDTLRTPCALNLNSGMPDAWKRHGLLMEEQ